MVSRVKPRLGTGTWPQSRHFKPYTGRTAYVDIAVKAVSSPVVGADSAQEARSDPFPFARDPWWVKLIVLIGVVLPVVGLVWAMLALWGTGLTSLDLGLLLAGWAIGGLGISVGYHRMLSHKAFDAPAPVRLVLLLMGSIALQGKPSDWAATHVRHHAKADREGDPHSPLEGLAHAHLGWLFRNRFVRTGHVHDKIREDPMVVLADKLWAKTVMFSLVFPFLVGLAVTGSLGGAWQAFLWGTAIRIVANHHLTWSVNSLGHRFGRRPYDTTDRSRNSLLLALVTWGEGWHNNHHAAPKSAFLGHRWYQIDIGGIMIRVMAWLRLARSLTLPPTASKKGRGTGS